MSYYDVDLAKVNATYHEQKLARQMQDSNADIADLTALWQKAVTAVSSWIQPKTKKETSRPIGGIQTSAR